MLSDRPPRLLAPLLIVILAATAFVGVSASPSGAIRGGEIPASQYSWMVAFVKPNDGRPIEERLVCSGVLIKPQYVLTSYHCSVSGTTVVIGRRDLRSTSGSVTRSIIANTPYSTDERKGDLRLIKLNSATSLAPLPVARHAQASSWDVGRDVRSYGYGCFNSAGGASRYVRRATFRMVTFSPSGPDATRYGYKAPYFFVARWSGRSLCSGDSGGPTVASTPSGPRVVGINSRTQNESNFYSKVGSRGSRNNSPVFYWLYDKGLA